MVESFKSTLDETRESDIIVHVVDLAHPHFEDHIDVVNATLSDLEAKDKPTLMVFNKVDLYEKRNFDEYLSEEVKTELFNELVASWQKRVNGNVAFISAIEKRNIGAMRMMLSEMITAAYEIRYPYKTQFF